MSSTTFIYALCEPGTRTVRYIGKANNPSKRRRLHLSVSSKLDTHLGHWLSRLRALDSTPELVVLCEVPKGAWKEEERRYIRSARAIGMNLVNGTDGGEGCFNPTPETRAKMRDSGKLRDITPMLKASKTPEAIAKRNAALKGLKRSPEACANISAGMKGIKRAPHTAESLAKRSAALKGKPPWQAILAAASPESRAKLSAALRGRKFTPEHCANISKSKTGVKVGKHSPERVAKRVASTKRTHEKRRAEHLARINLILSSLP